jgi:hypothetical protein
MANLQNQSGLLRELRQRFCLTRDKGNGFFDEHVLAHLKQLTARFEVDLRRRHDDRRVDLRKKRTRVITPMTLREINRIESLLLTIGNKKLDRHRSEHAQMIHTPSPHTNEKNPFHLSFS